MTVDDFVNGKFVILVDKSDKDSIEEFSDLVCDRAKFWPNYEHDSVKNYLMSSSSGPYHFFRNPEHLTGAPIEYVRRKFNVPTCTLRDFLLANSGSMENIEDEDYFNILEEEPEKI